MSDTDPNATGDLKGDQGPRTSITVGAVKKPTLGTPDSTRASGKPAAPRMTPKPSRSKSGRKLEKWMPTVAAALLASPVLARPLIGLVLALVAALVLRALLRDRSDRPGLADLVVGPISILTGAVRRAGSLLNPVALVKALWTLTKAVVVAVIVPAALATIPWYLAEGSEGAPAAARQAIVAHSPRVFAFLVAAATLRAVLRPKKFNPAADRFGSFTERRSEAALTGSAVATAAAVIIFGLVAGGNRWAPFASGEDVVAALPSFLEEPVIERQMDWAQSLAVSTADCINSELGYLWSDLRVQQREDGGLSVEVTASVDDFAEIADAVAAAPALATALHNQLPPWVHEVSLGLAGRVFVVLDRTELRTDVPLAPPEVETALRATTALDVNSFQGLATTCSSTL